MGIPVEGQVELGLCVYSNLRVLTVPIKKASKKITIIKVSQTYPRI
jgi:hypothetical protein